MIALAHGTRVWRSALAIRRGVLHAVRDFPLTPPLILDKKERAVTPRRSLASLIGESVPFPALFREIHIWPFIRYTHLGAYIYIYIYSWEFTIPRPRQPVVRSPRDRPPSVQTASARRFLLISSPGRVPLSLGTHPPPLLVFRICTNIRPSLYLQTAPRVYTSWEFTPLPLGGRDPPPAAGATPSPPPVSSLPSPATPRDLGRLPDAACRLIIYVPRCDSLTGPDRNVTSGR